jgi:undecaprenyl-diphosphatase
MTDTNLAVKDSLGVSLHYATLATAASPPVARKIRVWLRTLFWLAAGVLAAYLLLPRVGELHQAWQALRSVRWEWLIPGVVVVSSTYFWAALALKGAVNHRLSLRHTALVQLAGSFVNKLTPRGVGGIGVNQRYLEQRGVERTAAVAGIALNMAAGLIVHVLSLTVVSALLGRNVVGRVQLPEQWPYPIAGLGVLVSIGLVLFLRSRGLRHKVTGPVITAKRGLVDVLRSPRRAIALFAGVAGVTAVNVLTLTVALHAVGANTSPFGVAAVYLGGAALASAQPTPGNLGAIEAALVAGLATQGVQTGLAVAGVLTYRLLAFWMPIIPGFLALRYLQHREVL